MTAPARAYRPRLGPPEVERIAALAQAGASGPAIAREIGAGRGAIAHAMLRDGIEPARPRRTLVPRRGYMRGAALVWPFSAAEDARLLRWEGEGRSYAEMGRRLGRAASTVKRRLMALARHDERAEAGQL